MQEMQELQIGFLGLKGPLEEEIASTPIFLPGESHGQRSLAGTVHGIARVGHDLMTKTHRARPQWLRLGTATAGGPELRSHASQCSQKKPHKQTGVIMKMLGNNGCLE